MQQTTNIMLKHYITRRHALDVLWMQRRRFLILCGDFSQAMIKSYSMYSGDVWDILERQQEYPSPLFDEEEKH